MPRPSVRSLWSSWLKAGGGGIAGRTAPRQPVVGTRPPFHGLVLGIDPSLRGTGLAVVAFEGPERMQLVESRTLGLGAKLSSAECLGEIHRHLKSILAGKTIRHAAVEATIHVQNFRTALTLGAARGAAIGVIAAEGIPVMEYAPLRIKQAVCGSGRAGKEQVAGMVARFLGRSSPLPWDESDAAAAAICHALTWRPEAEEV